AGSSCSTASPPSQIPTASRCTNIVEVATSWVSSPAAWPVIALAKPTIAIATATMRATVTEDPVTAMVVAVAETTNASTSQIPRSVPRKTFRSDPKRSEPTACPVATAYENAREAPRASVVTAAAIATRVIARVRSPGSRSSQPARTDPPRATATARSAINAETGAPRRAIRPASRSTTLLPPAASAASTAIRARTATVTAAAPSSSGEGRAGGACRGAAGPAARPPGRVLWSRARRCGGWGRRRTCDDHQSEPQHGHARPDAQQQVADGDRGRSRPHQFDDVHRCGGHRRQSPAHSGREQQVDQLPGPGGRAGHGHDDPQQEAGDHIGEDGQPGRDPHRVDTGAVVDDQPPAVLGDRPAPQRSDRPADRDQQHRQ